MIMKLEIEQKSSYKGNVLIIHNNLFISVLYIHERNE